MNDQTFIDLVQTFAITVNVMVLVYVVWRLERAFENAADKLRQVLSHEQATAERIADIENRISLAGLKKRLDELEKGDK